MSIPRENTKICDEFCVRTSVCRLLSMHLKVAIYYYFRFNHVWMYIVWVCMWECTCMQVPRVGTDFCWQHRRTPRILSRAMKETVKDVSKVKQLILCRTCNKPLSFVHHRLGVLISRGSLLLSQTPHHTDFVFSWSCRGFYKEDWTQSFKDYF